MTDEPTISDTGDLANGTYDAGRRPGNARGEAAGAPPPSAEAEEAPEVGLAQKGDGEAAVVRRETEV